VTEGFFFSRADEERVILFLEKYAKSLLLKEKVAAAEPLSLSNLMQTLQGETPLRRYPLSLVATGH